MARKSGFVRSNKPSGYEKVPDSLLGFRKPEKGRGESQPHSEGKAKSHRVMVEHEGQKAFKDEVRAQNAKQALERAKRNWPGAKIRVTSLVRGVGGALLSPAVLAEEVAARAARDVTQKRDEILEKKRLTQRPKRRA